MNLRAIIISFWLVIISALYVAAGVTGTNCLAADVPSRGPIPFATYDRDGNGSISEQEFNAVREQRQADRATEGRLGLGAANAPSFSEIDRNGDGAISPEELTAAHQAQWEKKGMGRGQGWW